ncbi:MAG: molybdopterin-guanine dinucleotide biosynthesis protein B [Methanoregula sp. PtaU1.Bin051]|nr:MAG: molybdopterin-guanine dinucleotide biosynthesis protein B [Methanoregula sp. PtaU1.Bin051]
MRIIQVVGSSNSGKTTLIRELVPALSVKGRVGVIKHLGDHLYDLSPGKDTTEFFSSGASISVGMDAEKSVAAIRTTSLDRILLLLYTEGIDFAVIEGFKTRPFPRVVIGDLATENCVIRNPSVTDIIASLEKFSLYIPPAGIRGQDKKGAGQA